MVKNLNYFTSSYIPNKKAHTIQILKMCDALSSNFNVKLICGYLKSNYLKRNFVLKNNFKIINIKIFKMRILNIILKILYLVIFKKTKNDILFTRDVHYAFFGLIFYNKIYLELHQTYLEKTNLSFYFLKWLFKKNKIKIIFISYELFKIYKKKICKPKSYVIAHDCSDDIFGQNSKSYKNKNKKLTVGYCGHLYVGRGIELIIELAKNEKNMIFNILGGFNIDRKKILKSVEIPDNIKFYSHKFYKDVSKFLLHNDILIAPYQKKLGGKGEIDTAKYMSPLKIFEYMSSKKAIICSNHRVLKEVLINNKNAILCDPDKFDDWKKAIKHLKNKKIREVLGKNAYEDFKKKFTWEKRVNQII